MNHARILIGGLIAGAILNVGEFLLNGVILAKQMEELFFKKCGIPMPGGSAFVILILATFLLGILIIYIYASIRPRCGPGPKTAIYAAIIAWFCVYFYQMIVGFALGITPANILMIGIVWGLVEYVAGALAGASIYKEP